jgi:hypothetical protein
VAVAAPVTFVTTTPETIVTVLVPPPAVAVPLVLA